MQGHLHQTGLSGTFPKDAVTVLQNTDPRRVAYEQRRAKRKTREADMTSAAASWSVMRAYKL